MIARVITGNRLDDGLVVFLARDGAWSPDIDLAKVAETEEDSALLETLGKIAEQARFVVGPHAIDVTSDAEHVKPVIYQQRLRAFGPSSHPEYGRDDVPSNFREGIVLDKGADLGDGI